MAKDKIETRGSTIFTDIAYDNGMLTVELVNGTAYQYRQFPKLMWDWFKKAASYGSFYNTYIKGVYQYYRIR